MSSDSDSSDNKELIRIEKLTLVNWVQWKSRFTLYLKSHKLYTLIYILGKYEKNTDKYTDKNYKALNALYGAVSKELHNEIPENDTSFKDAWDALASACGQNLVTTICAAY
ncbi:uncharacterized protein PGTG_10229 [Puccinia graminis f. sp. tritici CRL 75-36-700-3]|uniref:Uncharacterized protein n=1 Tax=Puccinia graminis f. sp. tritici (strain CRL 75-36-700-3 / race SCCL) TaxID=418459 RepID=E3KJN4_PUCGT|nr:uncharacterized protein PGTG_10229 [Puccinia graminis f. sp. tritici CRL 75-36-700-3]EFP84509.1 hypothetical protein PGTG_10229 [Puccinia graminis f. sp. tritici CRL 75-36-700-3]